MANKVKLYPNNPPSQSDIINKAKIISYKIYI